MAECSVWLQCLNLPSEMSRPALVIKLTRRSVWCYSGHSVCFTKPLVLSEAEITAASRFLLTRGNAAAGRVWQDGPASEKHEHGQLRNVLKLSTLTTHWASSVARQEKSKYEILVRQISGQYQSHNKYLTAIGQTSDSPFIFISFKFKFWHSSNQAVGAPRRSRKIRKPDVRF